MINCMNEGYMMHGDYGLGMGFGFGWIFTILFWVLIILGIVYLVKVIAGGSKKDGQGETAFDILNKRYARGEITREEFEKMKADISGSKP
jgi:putative membrane protein